MIESGIIEEMDVSPNGNAIKSASVTLLSSCCMTGLASLSNVSPKYLRKRRHKICDKLDGLTHPALRAPPLRNLPTRSPHNPDSHHHL